MYLCILNMFRVSKVVSVVPRTENILDADPFNDSVCSNLGLCGVQDEPDILRCHCDGLCHFYGDCCHGYQSDSTEDKYVSLLSEHIQVAGRSLKCQTVKGHVHDFWLVQGDAAPRNGMKSIQKKISRTLCVCC